MRMMSKIVLSLLILYVGMVIRIQPAYGLEDVGWVIEEFNAQMTINKDTSVDVTEEIRADFKALEKHGIYRTIPVKYHTRYGNNLDIRFELKSITNKAGESYQVKQTNEDNNVKLRIGDPDETVSGVHTYVISYQINRVITVPDDNAEFYWNVTGNNWPVPILSSLATVTAPNDSILNKICFTGFYGEANQNCIHSSQGTVASFETGQIDPGEGFTVAVALDEELLAFPGIVKRCQWFLVDNWLYAVPLLTLLIMLRIYWVRGRDKQYINIFNNKDGVEPVPLFQKLNALTAYGPPKNLSPGEVGVLVDEKVHLRDITSVAIDLARRGYFNIKEHKKKGLFVKTEYELVRTNKDEKALLAFETAVMAMLFGAPRKKSVKLNKLPKDSYKFLDSVHDRLYEHLTETGYFVGNPKSVRRGFLVGGVLLAVLGGMIIAPVLGTFFGLGGAYFAVIVSGLIVIAFSFFMPARSAKGRKALKEIAGLQEWIRLGAWREQIHEKLNFFEVVLPYTIAFGMTGKFIKAFKDADLKKLAWYQSDGPVSTAYFISAMNSFDKSIASGVAATRPKSSNSGGSGFSGGGFSGGGFGGGGGGSW